MREIDRFRHTWNCPAERHLRDVEIEDDTLRDGLQGAFVRRPAVAEKIELLGLAASIGVQFAMLGFPSSSRQEYADCAALVAAIDEHGRDVANPVGSILCVALMCRHSLGNAEAGRLIEAAVSGVLERARTPDVWRPGCDLVSTTEMGRRVLERLAAVCAHAPTG